MVWLQNECISGIPMLLDYLNYIAIRLLEHGIVLCLINILQIVDRLEDEVLNTVCGIPITGHPMPRVVAEQLLKLLATESPPEPKNVQKISFTLLLVRPTPIRMGILARQKEECLSSTVDILPLLNSSLQQHHTFGAGKQGIGNSRR
jgi:hypothetical protein